MSSWYIIYKSQGLNPFIKKHVFFSLEFQRCYPWSAVRCSFSFNHHHCHIRHCRNMLIILRCLSGPVTRGQNASRILAASQVENTALTCSVSWHPHKQNDTPGEKTYLFQLSELFQNKYIQPLANHLWLCVKSNQWALFSKAINYVLNKNAF